MSADERRPEDAPPQGKPDDPRDPFARQLMQYGGIGIMFPVAIAMGFLAGRWLDDRLGTGPWLSLAGFLFGVIAALRNLLRSVGSMDMDDSSDTPDD
jgi:F0F1-type ATP synthase assembly protein I